MQKHAKEISHFFYSQAFVDGFRATFAILFPALLGYYINQFELGLTLALGAFCVSITDEPGPFIRKRRGMLFCILFIFLIASITPLARTNPFLMGFTIAAVCFVFSMFIVYGHRAAAVGTSAILIMILIMDEIIPPNEILPNSLSLAAGGTWYMVLSLFLNNLQPYRPAQRAVGRCIREIATYSSIRADFYNQTIDLESNYKKMVAQHIVVNEMLEQVREILYKTRQIVKETTVAAKKLLFVFDNAVDYFEETTATYYQYEDLRKRYSETGILEKFSLATKKIAAELDVIGISIESNSDLKKPEDLFPILENLKIEIDNLDSKTEESTIILKKILVNLRSLVERTENFYEYFKKEIVSDLPSIDHSRFITSHKLDPKILSNNITIRSSIFRHSIRLSAACTTGFILGEISDYGQYSYWILLTIAIILKPAFSLTKKLNSERIIGTIAGGLMGVGLLIVINDSSFHFSMLVLFMLVANSLMRSNYTLMTMATTVYVVMFFSLLGAQFLDVVPERIIDTIIGGGIAFIFSYFLFPTWERQQVKQFMIEMLHANAEYLNKILIALSGKQVRELDYKLARKEVYIHSANLSAAFQRMISEPKSKQANKKLLHQFVVLNHILLSNIATVATTLFLKEQQECTPELHQVAKNSYKKLVESQAKLENTEVNVPVKEFITESIPVSSIQDYEVMKDQLVFILKICTDLKKIVDKFCSKEDNG